jgi:hypothetical protein
MPLVDLHLSIDGSALPAAIHAFLREAEQRIERFQFDHLIPGFVPSDFERTYHTLRTLMEAGLAPGMGFCEWGSGFGVVACLAAMLDFDACGIEIEGELVQAARRLADDFGLPVEFVRGSFIPRGGEACVGSGDEFSWLTTDAGSAYEELGLGSDDFDVIFAYPWPDEEQVTEALFEHCAAVGAVLVTYHGDQELRLRRKTRTRTSLPRRQRRA